MAIKGHNIFSLDIKSLLNGDEHYLIPVYQRNYAWQESQITQLIQDIIDYIPESEISQDYYIGTLVAYERKADPNFYYETIDGQQRVTTLTLLTSAIRHYYPEVPLAWFKKINLDFESRKSSSDTLHHIYMYGKDFSADYSWNESIVEGFELCREILKRKLSENNTSIGKFAEYLFNRVKILRVTVPEDTDLNHYFEIMNNRGEQLEKHEILKSKFLELLNVLAPEERVLALSVFNLVWEACSNMEKYLQYGFSVAERNAVFGDSDWNTLQPLDFFELSQALRNTLSNPDGSKKTASLTEIIAGNKSKITEKKSDESPERFNAVINFPNFLLHVLRIYTRKDIPLDDKRLITTFEVEMKAANDKIRFAQEFAYELLRCKFLFDKYIIKREFIGGVDRWSLKRLKWYKDNKVSYVNTFGAADDDSDMENRTLLMLLSMFHVSTPTLVYKHWLNAALLFVTQHNDHVSAEKFKNHLIATARSFIFDRFLSRNQPRDYYDIIYKTNSTVQRKLEDVNFDKLVFQEGIENIIFNYLDYLLWERHRTHKDKRIREFEFSFRSSVEHYYPRNPMPGYKVLETKELDSFGNLCLISHSKNSRLSNQPPIAKRSHYNKQTLDSIKQWVMMTEYNADEWDNGCIDDHNNKMLGLLTQDINSDYDASSLPASHSKRDSKAWRWFNQFKNDVENKSLLVRAIMCFGDVAVEAGKTNYLNDWHPKFFLYDWDAIKTGEAFGLFCNYIDQEDPTSLSAVIEHQLANNGNLTSDPYRFVFVKHSEIWSYCLQGYFTWVNEGNQILLHERERNKDNVTRDLMIHLLYCWFENKFDVDLYAWREGFGASINFSSSDTCFVFSSATEGKGDLLIDCEDPGKVKCRIQPLRNSSNNSFVHALIDYGWHNAEENYYQRGSYATVGLLTPCYEDVFLKLSEKIESILKNGLGIKQ